MIFLPSSYGRNVVTVWATSFALLAIIALVDAGAILGEVRNTKTSESARGVEFDNHCGRKIDCFWVNTFEKPETFVPQFVDEGVSVGCPYGAQKGISSYNGHTFELREIPSKKSGGCVHKECRKVRYTVTDRFEQKVIVNRDFTLTVKDDRERAYSKADDIYSKCQEKVGSDVDPLESIELITKCVEEEITGDVINHNKEERSFHSKVHRTMADELVPYTCADVNKTQSTEVKNITWIYTDDDGIDETHIAKTLHKLPTSEIFVIDDFVTEEVCDALDIYRSKTHAGYGVPSEAAMEETKQGGLLMDVYYKMYQVLMDRYPNWKELDFQDDLLFSHIKDNVGFKTPAKLCTTQEEVDEVVAAMGLGKPKKCLIPGGVPEHAPTKHFVVENGISEEEMMKKRQLAQLFLFCGEPKDQLGGLHFPYAAVHVTPKTRKLVVAVHRHADAKNHKYDGYVNEYHLCPNHDVYVHTVFDHNPPPFVTGEDEGEL